MLELVTVRLHDRIGSDLGVVAVPRAWALGRGDVLVTHDDRLVRVVELVELPGGIGASGLAKVAPAEVPVFGR